LLSSASPNTDFPRALEEIKSRTPVEDLVREYVPTLKRSGALWQACCPFHEEKTPSFKVDPRKGYWRCYGACDEGGDQIDFIKRHVGVEFMEAVRILASRVGVELPERRGAGPDRREDPGYEVLARAASFYQRQLARPEGAAAREYLEERGLSAATVEAFGLGWAPASGRALAGSASGGKQPVPFDLLERCGLARRKDGGRPYDFFRGRLMIPIRDLEGRVVGFGGRRLGDGDGPKYVNTPETDLFKKSRLIYGLDLALAEARRARHLVLMEGYTDVMAAHQVGLPIAGAVLGTSTTEDHARLVRRAGARRVSLVFDGDEAGSRAARKALRGLLHLEVPLHVVRLPGGQDPCDLLLGEGREAFEALLEAAPPWEEALFPEAAGLRGTDLSREVDELLELIHQVKAPVERSSLIRDLSEATGLAVPVLEEQWRLRGQRPAVRPAVGPDGGQAQSESRPAAPPVDRQLNRIFADLIGALLLDASLTPRVEPHLEACEDPRLRRVLEAILELYQDLDAVIDPSSVMNQLGEDEARSLIPRLADRAAAAACPQELVDGALERLQRRSDERRAAELSDEIRELEQGLERAAPDERASLEERLHALYAEYTELMKRTRGDAS
jgi:DNA primase